MASRTAVKYLHNLPLVFIPLHDEFASPIQIARRVEQELSPHLFDLPDTYAPYSHVLRLLGMDTEARPFHYARVLEGVFVAPTEAASVSTITTEHFWLRKNCSAVFETVKEFPKMLCDLCIFSLAKMC